MTTNLLDLESVCYQNDTKELQLGKQPQFISKVMVHPLLGTGSQMRNRWPHKTAKFFISFLSYFLVIKTTCLLRFYCLNGFPTFGGMGIPLPGIGNWSGIPLPVGKKSGIPLPVGNGIPVLWWTPLSHTSSLSSQQSPYCSHMGSHQHIPAPPPQFPSQLSVVKS